MVSPLRVAATRKTFFPVKGARGPARTEVTFILMSRYSWGPTPSPELRSWSIHGWPSSGLKGSGKSSTKDELPEDGVALAKLDLVPLLQPDKLPPHKGVIEGVLVSGDETPSPVHVETFGTWEVNILSKRATAVTFYPFSCSRDDTVGGNAPASDRDHQT